MTDPHSYVPLREYVDNRLDAALAGIEKRFDLQQQTQDRAVASIERAVNKAEGQLRERLAGQNEFRDQLKDQAATLATRQYVEFSDAQLNKSLDSISDRLSYLEKQAANSDGRTWMLITGMGVLFSIIGLALRFL